MGICKLCLKDSKLIKAHIIPEFMYKGMKDEKNVFYKVTYDLDSKSSKKKKIQTGDFDKNILCAECDNGIIGARYERYAQLSMYGEDLDPNILPDCKNFKFPTNNGGYTICTNIDYCKMKLFVLSILFRASVSNLEIFKEISLGAKHEERIRDILLNEVVPEEKEYPIVLTSFLKTKNSLKNLIAQPKRIRYKNNINAYIFLIDSIQYLIFVNSTSHTLPDFVKNSMLKKTGEMTILHHPEGAELKFIKNIINS